MLHCYFQEESLVHWCMEQADDQYLFNFVQCVLLCL